MGTGRLLGRVVGGGIALGLAVVGVGFIGGGRRADQAFEAAQTAEPIRIPVDLSKPGTYTGPFRQTYTYSHGEEILVEVSPPFASATDAEAAGRDLAFALRIQRGDGRAVLSDDGESRPAALSPQDGRRIPLRYFHPFPRGEYTLWLRVIRPAPALADRQQQLVARHLCCGLEGWFALVDYGLGGGCLVLALVVGLVTWRLTVPRPGGSTCP